MPKIVTLSLRNSVDPMCFPVSSSILKAKQQNQSPLKLLKLSGLLFLSFENRSDKTGDSPLKSTLRTRALSQRILKIRGTTSLWQRKAKGPDPHSGACDHESVTACNIFFRLVRYQGAILITALTHSKTKAGWFNQLHLQYLNYKTWANGYTQLISQH